MPRTIAMKMEYFSFTKRASVYLCSMPICVKTCWLHNINLVETLKLVKYLWTEIQNLDGIGDFGWTENELLDSMFVQSLTMHCG